MSVVNLSVKHGRSLEEAKQSLEEAVREIDQRFGSMIERVEWSADRSAVKLAGSGLTGDVRVDAQEVHVTVDIPLLLRAFSKQVTGAVQEILQHSFPKQLPK